MNGEHTKPVESRTEDLVSRLRAKAAKGGVIPIHDATIEEAADVIEGRLIRQDIEQRALANLLDAVGGVLTYDWSDSDSDAVEAIDRLQKAAEDYGTVQRLKS